MARRGFLAQLLHLAKVAAQEQARADREAERARKAAVRQLEQARKAEEPTSVSSLRTPFTDPGKAVGAGRSSS